MNVTADRSTISRGSSVTAVSSAASIRGGVRVQLPGHRHAHAVLPYRRLDREVHLRPPCPLCAATVAPREPAPTPPSAPAPRPRSPKPAPPLTVTIVSLPPTGQGNVATATAQTAPSANCSIVVEYKSRPSTAQGLYPKTASATGTRRLELARRYAHHPRILAGHGDLQPRPADRYRPTLPHRARQPATQADTSLEIRPLETCGTSPIRGPAEDQYCPPTSSGRSSLDRGRGGV